MGLIKSIKKRFKKRCENENTRTRDVDIVVLNASAERHTSIQSFSKSDYDFMYRTNVEALFIMMSEYGKLLSSRGWGRIIYIGSTNQERPMQRLSIYASTKAAGQSIAQVAAKEFASSGVTVNTIAPGIIATDRSVECFQNIKQENIIKNQIPLKRYGLANDCVGAALLLASEAGSYITGATIRIDGGYSLVN